MADRRAHSREHAAAATRSPYFTSRMRTPVLLRRYRCGTGDIYQTMPLLARRSIYECGWREGNQIFSYWKTATSSILPCLWPSLRHSKNHSGNLILFEDEVGKTPCRSAVPHSAACKAAITDGYGSPDPATRLSANNRRALFFAITTPPAFTGVAN